MSHIRLFEEFINEASQEGQSFTIENFINFIEKDLSWNGAKVKVIDPDKMIFEVGKSPKQMFPKHNLFFMYTCRDGSSVKKDIEKSCKDFGSTTCKVGVISNRYRNMDHEYLIALNVSPTVLQTSKNFQS